MLKCMQQFKIGVLTLPGPPNSQASLSKATLYFPGKSHPILYLDNDRRCQVLTSDKPAYKKVYVNIYIPFISIFWMKIEYKHEISTFKYNNLKRSQSMSKNRC